MMDGHLTSNLPPQLPLWPGTPFLGGKYIHGSFEKFLFLKHPLLEEMEVETIDYPLSVTIERSNALFRGGSKVEADRE
jgi:hypothetical protein